MPPHTTKRRTTIKNKKQPELTENRTVWKSDNQGDKEETSRWVGGAETGSRVERTHHKAGAGGPSEVVDCGTGQARLQLADPAAPHSHTDNWEEQWGSEADLVTQGSSSGK